MDVLYLVLLLGIGSTVTAIYSPELSVNLTNGSPVLGQYMTSYSGHGIRAFLNIPYAEPPIGKLRFANPVSKKPWSEDLSNSEQVIVCPQVDVFFSGPTIIGQEDCLYLNVYVPLVS